MLERYSLTWPEIVYAREKKPRVMYDPKNHTISHVAIYLTDDGRLAVDRLPTFGYLVSYYEAKDLGEKIVFLKGDVFPFWDAMFLNEKLKYPVLFLETGEIKECYVKIVYSGVESMFSIEFGGGVVYFNRKDYEKKIVVLNQ